MDKHFRVEQIVATPHPQAVVYVAAKNDYSETFIGKLPNISEEKAGEKLEEMLWKSKTRPHLGPYEHPQITFSVGGYPHNVAMQLRTHRVGITFDVQSQRYTGQRILKVVNGDLNFDDVFYLRSIGVYQNRQGRRFELTEPMRREKKEIIMATAKHYADYVGVFNEPEESARDILSQAIRQNFFVSMTARTLMHLILVRSAKDVQLECRNCIDKMLDHFDEWMPQTSILVREKFYIKGNLTP